MESKENKKEPELLRSEIIEVKEDPEDKPRLLEMAASGTDMRKHKFQARYKITTFKEFYSDGSNKITTKDELLPNSLKDLGPAEESAETPEKSTVKAKKDNVIIFHKAS